VYKINLKPRQYRHVYRMPDTHSQVGASCDCHRVSSTACLHILLIEWYHEQFDEPILDGEQPAAFLVNLNYEDLQYLYSIASTSGSERHHSHKRIIMTCDLSMN
jgi:hypothetical protein